MNSVFLEWQRKEIKDSMQSSCFFLLAAMRIKIKVFICDYPSDKCNKTPNLQARLTMFCLSEHIHLLTFWKNLSSLRPHGAVRKHPYQQHQNLQIVIKKYVPLGQGSGHALGTYRVSIKAPGAQAFMESLGCDDVDPYGKEDSAVTQCYVWPSGASSEVWAQRWGRSQIYESDIQQCRVKQQKVALRAETVSELLNVVPRAISIPAFIK